MQLVWPGSEITVEEKSLTTPALSHHPSSTRRGVRHFVTASPRLHPDSVLEIS